MASIPLPALSVQQPPSVLEQYGKVMQLRNLGLQQQQFQQQESLFPGQQELQKAQITGANQQNQIGANQVKLSDIEVKDQQLLSTLYPQFTKKTPTNGAPTASDTGPVGYDFEGLKKKFIDSGGSFKGLNQINGIQSQNAELTTKLAGADEATRKNQQSINSAMNDAIETLQGIPDLQARKQALPGILGNLQKLGVDTSNLSQVDPSDENLAKAQATLGMHQQVIEDATKLVNLQKAKAEEGGSSELQAQKAWLAKNPGKDASDYAIMMKKLVPQFNLNLQQGLLTDQAKDMAAENYWQTGTLPAGARSPGIISSIVNRAAQLHPGGVTELAGNRAAYEANKKSYDNVTTTLDTLSAFEQSGLKNLKQFTDLASKLPDTGVPWLNTPVRNLNKNLVGAEYMPAIEAARSVALREIARVTNDPKLSGSLTDAARGEVAAFSPANATLPQIKHVVEVLTNDMANVRNSLAAQKQDIGARLGIKSQGVNAQGGSQSSDTSAAISVTAPNGKVYHFADQKSADNFKKDAGIK